MSSNPCFAFFFLLDTLTRPFIWLSSIPYSFYLLHSSLVSGVLPFTDSLTHSRIIHSPTYPTLPYLPLARSLTHSTTHQPTHLLSGSRTQSLGSSIRSCFQLFPVSSCFCVHLFASEAIMTLSSINEHITLIHAHIEFFP